jgi:ubiquinone/menaquinone biosynthesis C-methylase UbiE
MIQKRILDVTCGDRTIWFQKNEPHTIYCDIRNEEWEGDFGKALTSTGKKKHRHLVINPDVQCSFTNLPFEDDSFDLVVFDPPHIENLGQNAWMRKAYGSLDGNWKPMIRKGFEECIRVLRVGGVLVFKWSDISVSTRDIIKVIGQDPLFGHRSGRKMNTHWMCYMKFEKEGDSHE